MLRSAGTGRSSTAGALTQGKPARTFPHTMAGLGLASVGFNKHLKFMLPLLGIWLVIILVVFVIAAV